MKKLAARNMVGEVVTGDGYAVAHLDDLGYVGRDGQVPDGETGPRARPISS